MTIFQKIIDRDIPADIVFEDDLSLAFRDIAPGRAYAYFGHPEKNHPETQ